jgi:hypothetical protein
MKKTLIFFFTLLIFSSCLFSQNSIKKHSPRKASTLSAILPGAGQVYNKQAWKIPIIYAGAGVATYLAVSNYQNTLKFKNEY